MGKCTAFGILVGTTDPTPCSEVLEQGAFKAIEFGVGAVNYVEQAVQSALREPDRIGEETAELLEATAMDPTIPYRALEAGIWAGIVNSIEVMATDPEVLLAETYDGTGAFLRDPERVGRAGFNLGFALSTSGLGQGISFGKAGSRQLVRFGDDFANFSIAPRNAAGVADDVVITPWGTRDVRTGKWAGGERGGVDPVDDFIARAEEHGYEVVGGEVDILTPFGRRRADLVLRDMSDPARVGGVELKSTIGEFNKFNKGQFAKDRFINTYGGPAVGPSAEAAEITRVDYMMKILWGTE